MECYCTCIIEILRHFFVLQSLTTSNCLSFTKQKLAGLKTGGLVGLWAFFEFFYIFFKYCSVSTKKLNKMKLKKNVWYLKKNLRFLNWNYQHKIFITMYSISYTRHFAFVQNVLLMCQSNFHSNEYIISRYIGHMNNIYYSDFQQSLFSCPSCEAANKSEKI